MARGPVLIMPAGAVDKEAAARLLAWMMSPEILAETAYANSLLPASRTSAQDPRLQQIPDFPVFMEVLAHPNAKAAVTTPISAELNQSLARVEAELLHEGGDPAQLLDEVQAELAPMLDK